MYCSDIKRYLAVRFGMAMRFGNHYNYRLQIEADF